MTIKTIAVSIGLISLAVAGALTALGDATTGKISDTSFGSFQLDENGIIRNFNLSSKTSKYDPNSWRPNKGDEVTVTFNVVESKRRAAVLAVDKVMLVKPGPDTITNLDNPVTVEIVESGRSGINAKLPKGQILKFSYGRETQRLPAGWVITAGETATIEFKTQPNRFSGGISYVIQKIEKKAKVAQ